MAQLVKKENITIVIGEYEKDGVTKKRYKTIGEVITMRGDDNSEYQFGELWGPTGSTEFKIFSQDNNNTLPGNQPMAQPASQALHQPQVGYTFANGAPLQPQDVQRYQSAGIPAWPAGQNPPNLPAGY